VAAEFRVLEAHDLMGQARLAQLPSLNLSGQGGTGGFGLSDLFSARVFSEDSPRKKPNPAPLQIALRRLGAKPQECVYVGDTPEDIEMARRAGMRSIGVLGPFPTAGRIRSAEPDLLLRSIRDLPRYLVRLA